MRRRLTKIIALSLIFSFGWAGSALAQDEPDKMELYAEANRLVERNRFSRALEVYQQIVEIDPTWGDVWYNMGEVSRVTDSYEDCARYFRGYLFAENGALDADAVHRLINRCLSELETGQLSVQATPAEASIAVDGVNIARGTLDNFEFTAGPHQVEVTLTDHTPALHSVDIVAGEASQLSVTLENIDFYGSLSVELNVEGVSIEVEGTVLGVTPLEEPLPLIVGPHLIRLVKEGYRPWTRRIEIFRDQTHNLDAMLREDDGS